MSELQFFDRNQDFTVTWRNLPHWAQAGTVCFITWRTADSLPAEVVQRMNQERQRLLLDHGLDPHGDWKAALAKRPNAVRGRIQWSLFEIWDRSLDLGCGACVLRDPALSALVGESLLHFDGQRYLVTDYAVMPNHVHLLVAFHSDEAMESQCTSWKRYTGRQIHRQLGQSGEFWQVEQFDHLVRSPEQFEHYRRYIEDNPRRARLPAGEYRHYSKATMAPT
jgi:putative transposase